MAGPTGADARPLNRGDVEVTVHLPSGLMARIDEIVQRENVVLDSVITRLLVQALPARELDVWTAAEGEPQLSEEEDRRLRLLWPD